MWSPKHSSFVCRLNGWSSAFPPLSSSPSGASAFAPSSGQTAFPEKKRLRQHAAALCGALRLRRGCGASALERRRGGRHERHWPGASIREGARHRVSPTWGASKKCWDQMITSSMFMNDHNAILDINFVYIYIILYLKTSFR